MTKKQDPRSPTTPSRPGTNDAKPGLSTPTLLKRHMGPNRTNNVQRYTTTTAQSGHSMAPTEHRQVYAGQRVPRGPDRLQPDKRVTKERWSDTSTSTGASATNNT